MYVINRIGSSGMVSWSMDGVINSMREYGPRKGVGVRRKIRFAPTGNWMKQVLSDVCSN